jgi:hypothetical protein
MAAIQTGEKSNRASLPYIYKFVEYTTHLSPTFHASCLIWAILATNMMIIYLFISYVLFIYSSCTNTIIL